MTTPIVLQDKGWGAAFAEGMAPLLKALEERKQRQLQQQQILTQMGELKLQQDKFAEETKRRNEQKKGLEEAAAAATQQYQSLGQPGDVEKEIAGIYGTGDPQLIDNLNKKYQRLQVKQAINQIGQKYAASVGGDMSQLTPEAQLGMLQEMQQVDPENTSIGNNISTLMASIRPKTNQNRQANVKVDAAMAKQLGLGPEAVGTYHAVATDLQTGARVDLGEVAPPYQTRFAEYGDVDQRSLARAALRGREAFKTISVAPAPVQDEVANALTTIEAGARFPTTLSDLVGLGTEVATRAHMSDAGQKALNAFWDVLAAEGFGEGGKQLTRAEWDKNFKPLAWFTTDSPASRLDKLKRLNLRWRTRAKQAGPAWDRIKNLSMDDADMHLQTVGALEDFAAQARALLENNQPKQPEEQP